MALPVSSLHFPATSSPGGGGRQTPRTRAAQSPPSALHCHRFRSPATCSRTHLAPASSPAETCLKQSAVKSLSCPNRHPHSPTRSSSSFKFDTSLRKRIIIAAWTLCFSSSVRHRCSRFLTYSFWRTRYRLAAWRFLARASARLDEAVLAEEDGEALLLHF